MDAGKIIEFESGEMSEEDTVKMFQEMIDDGSVWGLQGSYGRLAAAFIASGLCNHSTEQHFDYYGHKLPLHKEAGHG